MQVDTTNLVLLLTSASDPYIESKVINEGTTKQTSSSFSPVPSYAW